MDVGFKKAGYDIIWANDLDKNACATYKANHGDHIRCGDLRNYLDEIASIGKVDAVIGGPPCQGFSVAGKMNPDDPRSQLLWDYLKVVEICKPEVFVCENVKALGTLSKWEDVRKQFLAKAHQLGYECDFVVLKAIDYNVPQLRERVFFVGSRSTPIGCIANRVEQYKKTAHSVREVISVLGRAGTESNSRTCNARITIAKNPIMRKSPYAGMLFNGAGRPTRLDGHSSTLPASMGGNKTPIIDEFELHDGKTSWVEEYHKQLVKGTIEPSFGAAPDRLRRMTIDEALRIQTFPNDYIFEGGSSSTYKQIGNAVPCHLAHAIALTAKELLEGKHCILVAEPTGQKKLLAI